VRPLTSWSLPEVVAGVTALGTLLVVEVLEVTELLLALLVGEHLPNLNSLCPLELHIQ